MFISLVICFVALTSCNAQSSEVPSASQTSPSPVGLRLVSVAQPVARVLAAPQQVLVRAAVPAPVAAVPVAAVDAHPRPYSFGYASGDEAGTEQDRQETQDENGIVRGTYGYRDAQGLFRRVEYIADAAGFRAVVRTNEPGVAKLEADPAETAWEVQEPPAGIYQGRVVLAAPAPVAVAPAPVAVAQARPVAVAAAPQTFAPQVLVGQPNFQNVRIVTVPAGALQNINQLQSLPGLQGLRLVQVANQPTNLLRSRS